MKQRLIVLLMLFVCIEGFAKKPKSCDRDYWVGQAYKMARPVLENMA